MIGVAAHCNEQDVVAELFELFKTPWEFYREDGEYDVLICTREQIPPTTAKLILLYSVGTAEEDWKIGVSAKSRQGSTIRYEGRRIPIYGNTTTFPESRFTRVIEESSKEPVIFATHSGKNTILRVGYNLFGETRQLLETGQPVVNAGIATLELHIALLRDLITKSGIPLVEIPPIPTGHNFIVCLTHDIDHPVLRNHCCDHTMAGFLYRATIGTAANVCRGRKSLRDLRKNWMAALKLPLIYLGMAKDIWGGFDRYVELEAGLAATYFVIPTRNYAGRPPTGGDGISKRAVRYDVADIQPQLRKVISSGCEVGLHGIDSWADSGKGHEERNKVTQTLDTKVTGVRMHWLYFDEKSPAVLERAGFLYDSTVGYNETVGFRAGTAQVYRPLGVKNLLELPMHIMDTALFFPDFMALRDEDAWRVVQQFVAEMGRWGGVLTINWHDRSVAPERLWDSFYVALLRELKGRRAWFATADQAVSWFRKRRSATVNTTLEGQGRIRIKASVRRDELPGLSVRMHRPGTWNDSPKEPVQVSSTGVDSDLEETIDTEIRF